MQEVYAAQGLTRKACTMTAHLLRRSLQKLLTADLQFLQLILTLMNLQVLPSHVEHDYRAYWHGALWSLLL